ncbi:MAG: serine/threonine protein kinase [Planctomycetes bacterium]|nr:serine/threonine protein kinase [Planctomycetota bacterium]
MSTDRATSDWTRVRALYEQLCDLPAAEREAALTRVCDGDAELRAAVEKLLAHDSGEGDSFLGAPVARLTNLAPTETFELAKGTEIGAFRIVRRLGQGGMGAVYEAEQQNPQRRVALKVLRPELATAEALRRFDIEVESLARMQHPDIARVHAAGIHAIEAQGLHLRLPWYAMELVAEARDLVSHAREQELDRAQRLGLLARVAEAVHHAHLRGIVHRDLKPANVLVDESGAPKVIDFGIARAIDQSARPETTRTGALLGTPRYMAPEQKSGSGDVDARCDVWALGCMLRELLELPSAPRATSSANASLPRELDWILARACAELPAERYGSALALAEDLRRCLRGDAVLAAPPSFVYEWAKLLKRHRTAFLGAATVLIALGAGLLITLDALQRERETSEQLSRSRAESEARRTAAESATARAEQELTLRTSTLDLFKRTIVTARSRFGAGLTLSQVVSELGAELERSPVDQPLAVGASWTYLAEVALANGNLAEAERMQRSALEALEGVTLDEQVRHERALGLCGLADLYRQTRRFEECAQAIAAARALAADAPQDERLQSSILRREVLLALQQGRFETAFASADENVALRERVFGPAEPETVEARLDRGVAATNAPDVPHALDMLEEACEEAEQVLGPLHQSTLIGKNNLAGALAKREEWPRCAAILEETAEAFVKLYGAEHPSAQALRSNLANAWTMLDRWADAGALFEELLVIAERRSPPPPGAALELLELRRMVSISKRRSGDLARAVEVVAGICPFEERDDEAQFAKRCACRIECARALALQGDKDGARGLLEETRDALIARFGAEHSLAATAIRELAALEARG